MEIDRIVGRRSNSIDHLPSSMGLISDTLLNDFVPFQSVFNGKYKNVKSTTGKELKYLQYFLPVLGYSRRTSNKLQHFLDYFYMGHAPLTYLKGGQEYNVSKQMIYEFKPNGDYNLLYTLALKKDYLFGGRMNLSSLDYSKFTIFLSKDWEQPEKRVMFNLLKREVITPLEELGVDVVYTKDITKWCFNNPAEPFIFDTLSSRREFLNGLHNNVLDAIGR